MTKLHDLTVQVHGELVVSEGELVEPLSSLLVDLETSWSSSHIPSCVQVHGELVVSEGELVEPLTSLLVDLETSCSHSSLCTGAW